MAKMQSRHGETKMKAVEALVRLQAHLTREQADEVSARILEILESSRGAPQRSLMIRALGPLKSRLSVKPLTALVRDRTERNVHVKRRAMATLLEIGDLDGVRAVVEALTDEDVYVRQGAAFLLAGLFGEEFGFDPRATAAQNKASLEKFRAAWVKKFGRAWDE